MAANIIDPNDAISSQSLINLGLNATPDYSDMFIFAELTAQRRAASVLTTNGVGKPSTLSSENDVVKINLMGFDQDTGEYTTRWTENIGGGITPFEGFGMTSIKMSTNSSYVPQFDIEFVDIRGLSLISLGVKSPYSVIYSFPPPIFKLTFKGYYGKAISYDLHLVKQSTRFDAQSGNYFININFIARRYAPLADVLFKYIDIVPLMNSNINPNSEEVKGMDLSFNTLPRNTRELITRAKKLYDDIDNIKVSSVEAEKLQDISRQIFQTESIFDSINNFQTTIGSANVNNTNIFTFRIAHSADIENGDDNITKDDNLANQIKTVNVYDSKVFASSPDGIDASKLNDRLCILYEYDAKLDLKSNTPVLDSIDADFQLLIKKFLDLTTAVDNTINASFIKYYKVGTLPPTNNKRYIGIDLTDYYVRLRKLIAAKKQDYATQNAKLKSKISQISTKTIGAPPTIRNIFTVLCNDVEVFFKSLRDVSAKAEDEHKKDFDKIVANNGTTNKQISAFPLILNKTSVSDNNGNNINRLERAYPGDPKLGFNTTYFPEVDFVENFIGTFVKLLKIETLENMKNELDSDGNNIWIPVNVIDSSINGRNPSSPYKNLNNLSSIMNEVMNRYYVASQFSYGYSFYNLDGVVESNILNTFFGLGAGYFNTLLSNGNDPLLKFIGQSEAVNLVNSITDLNLLNSLQIQVQQWKSTINTNDTTNSLKPFYSYLQSNVPHYSSFSDQVDSYGNYLLLNGEKVTKNRTSSFFAGFELVTVPKLRNAVTSVSNKESDGETNLVDEFINDFGSQNFFKKFIFNKYGFDVFTQQNFAYVPDDGNKTDPYDSDFIDNFVKDDTLLTNFYSKFALNNDALNFLNDSNVTLDIKLYWIVNDLCAAFSYFDNKVNGKFSFPSIIEIPEFAHLNMSMLAYFWSSTNTLPTATVTSIAYTKSKYASFSDTLKFDDTLDPNIKNIQNIGDNDASNLVKYVATFLNDTTNTGFLFVLNSILALINDINALHITDSSLVIKEYIKRLTPTNDNTGKDYSFILLRMMQKKYLLNYSQMTFFPVPKTNNGKISFTNFTPLITLNNFSNNKKANDTYFSYFLSKIDSLCDEKKKGIVDRNSKIQSTLNDNDLKNQTYYSFKAIADKWVVGLSEDDRFGFSKKLIDEFSFIDRFSNDIGDKVMIDFRPLIDFSQDYDVSVFSVMARLLALNGFEFFPLQNFLNFNGDEWSNSFKTYGSSRNLIKSQTPAFVCMYIGGTSSQLDDPASGFEDDGFKDENSLLRSPDYDQNKVKGFKVAFAKQNQSMFTSIDLNTNEHKETNESLAILSEIAQDQSAASPVPKGQNLYSTYEQRSYNCNVQGLGNALIQPTQYFLLENVPMFNGAYLILNVEHNIIGNSMKTSFNGVRVRSNPNPLVTDFYSAISPENGDTTNISTVLNPDPNNSAFPTTQPSINDLNNLNIKP